MPWLFRRARLAALVIGLILAATIGLSAVLPPPVRPVTAPPAEFSAERAMADVRILAQRPHSATSTNLVRVRDYLFGRLSALGLDPQERHYMIDPEGLRTLRRWNARADPSAELVDLVGILPGRDRLAPAVLVMAHMDTVWGSPGGGDDSVGVATILELVRAIKARGTPARDIVVLLTDGEEIGLSGARDFWSGQGLPGHVGVVVNLEARGAGGRAVMFETGSDNGAMIDLMQGAVRHPVANSLAVMAYRRMPNDTDFTPVRDAGIPGFNFAIMGRPQYYHSPKATADRVDAGSVQDIGDQTLDLVSALADTKQLPDAAPDVVFFDLAGHGMLAYPPAAGWWLVIFSTLALAIGAWTLMARRLMTLRAVARGALAFIWLAAQAFLLLRLLNLISGSAHSNYYDRLAALPRLEAQALLGLLAVLLGWAMWRRWNRPVLGLAPPLLLALPCWLAGDGSAGVFAAAAAGMAAAWWAPAAGVPRWGGWIGALVLLVLASIAAQAEAPMVAWLLEWPALIIGIAAAVLASHDPRFECPWSWAVVALAAVLVTAPLIPLGHLTFLGVGAAMPEVLVPMMLIAAVAWWPLVRIGRVHRAAPMAVAVLLVMALAIAVRVRTDPVADTIPAYALDK